VTLDGQHVQVQCVAPSNVQIQANGQLGVLDPVSDTERQALLVMWEAQRKQAEEDYARALLAWAEQKQQERERAATAALAAAQAQAAATAAVKTVLSPAHAAPGADLASPPDAWITCLPIGYGWPGYWGWSGRRNW